MTNCNFWPLTPPFALMSSTYISSVFFSGSPRNDAGPVTERTEPILICADAWCPALITASSPRPAIAVKRCNALMDLPLLIGGYLLLHISEWKKPRLDGIQGRSPRQGPIGHASA